MVAIESIISSNNLGYEKLLNTDNNTTYHLFLELYLQPDQRKSVFRLL